MPPAIQIRRASRARRLGAACLLLLGVAGAACSAEPGRSGALAASPRAGPGLPPVRYPETVRVAQVDDYHGVPVEDPYRWLEDDDSPQTAEWVARQNALSESVLAALPQREALRRRLTELWNTPRLTPPVRHGGLWTWSRNDGLQAQDVLMAGAEPGADGARVLLDPNAWSADGTLALAGSSPSRDGRFVAYSISDGGSDWRTIRVRDVAAGADTSDALSWVKFSTPAWNRDGSGFYYGRFPAPAPGDARSGSNTHMALWFHRLGESQERDVLVHANPDEPTWNTSAEVSDDGRWLVRSTSMGAPDRNLLHVRPEDEPSAPWIALNDAWDTDLDYLGNDGDRFYLRTRLDAPRGRVVAVDVSRPGRDAWTTLVPEQADTLRRAWLFRDRLLLGYLHDAHDRLVLTDLQGGALQEVELPGLGTVSGIDGTREDGTVYFGFASFTDPGSIQALEIETGRTTEHWRPELRFDPAGFVTEQVEYASRDGTRVPMFLVHRRDVGPDGRRPVLLQGYGGFAAALTPSFNAAPIPVLERGGVLAQPSLRGGGEFGEDWHRAGMLERKQNVFDDFIAAAEWLQSSGWTRPELLAITGRSNGGLLVGAAMTQRPELFGCAVPGVGVMDMLRFHRFTIGWAWVPEYGSADDPQQFPFLRAYSPLQNIRPGTRYPPTLILTADHDDRVVPAHSFKFGATLQAAQAGPAPVLLRIETRAGHGAGKPVEMRIAEAADSWAFILAALGQG